MKAKRVKAGAVVIDPRAMTPRVKAAVDAWLSCDARADWGTTIEALSIATWRGVEVAWVRGAGDEQAMYRVADSRVIDPEWREALTLPWVAHEFRPAFIIPVPRGSFPVPSIGGSSSPDEAVFSDAA